ncbi:MAG: Cna B-type domain-containing protein [Lachnospiraceae bacterium]
MEKKKFRKLKKLSVIFICTFMLMNYSGFTNLSALEKTQEVEEGLMSEGDVVEGLAEEQETTEIEAEEESDYLSTEYDLASTTDTFISNGGSYAYDYILQNIGVFSFNDVSAVHIVGPIIAKGQVYNINNASKGIDFGNYHQGVSSYVQGGLNPYTSTTPAMDAIYDNSEYLSRMPVFYTGTANQTVVSNDGSVYTINGQELLAMYDTKYWNSDLYVTGGIYGNNVEFTDNYIDWNAARNAFNAESKSIASSAKAAGRNITSEDLITATNNPYGGKVLVVEPGDVISIDGDTFLTQKGDGNPIELAVSQAALNQLYGEITAIVIKSDSEYFSDQIVLNVEGEGNYTIPSTYYCSTSADPSDANNWYKGTIENWYYGYNGNTVRPYINMFWNIAGNTSNPGEQEIYFPDNTDRDAIGIGNIVAPNSKVYINYGDYNGTVICDDIINRSEIHMMTSNVSIIPVVTETSRTVTKVWYDNNNQDGIRPDSITVELLADGVVIDTVTLDASNNWTYTWTGLPTEENENAITYDVEEVGTITGYTSTNQKDEDGNVTITNSHIPDVVNKSVTKVWDDNNNQDGNRPASITVQLKGNESNYGDVVTLSEENNWSYTWSDLPKYENKEEIIYSVVEVETPADYAVTYTEKDGTFTITNSYTPGKVSKTVTKNWDDSSDQDGFRPVEIDVQLYADGKEYGDIISLDDSNNWTYTWNNLTEKNSGKTIEYTVKEVKVPDGYEVSYSEDTFTITNTYIPEMVERTVTKTWDDNDNQDGSRPSSIMVQLKGNGSNYGDVVTLSEENNWSYTWSDLPKYENKEEIIYSVVEVETPADYAVTYTEKDGTFTITNSYTPGEVSKTVSKNWNDSGNKEDSRPANIKVQLYAGGEKYGDEVTLDKSNNWAYTWNNLPEYASGESVVYTVKEIDVPDGYKVSYSEDTFTITNTPTSVTKTTSGTKTTTGTKTGDESNMILWLLLIAVSAVGILTVILIKKRKRN